MFLNKLLLKDFGKFNNKEIDLNAGINLVCTDSEAKKSSFREFIIGMLYGINRFKGLGDSERNYERIKSISGKNSSGKIYIKSGDKSYFVERSFQRNSSKASVLDVQSGREFKLKKRDSLFGSFVDVDKNTYTNGLCIEPTRRDNSRELARDIQDYVANITLAGTPDIDKTMAVEILRDEKRKYDTRSLEREVEGLGEQIEEFKDVDEKLSDIRGQIHDIEEEFAIETARRKREARNLVETKDGETFEDNDEINESLDKLAESTTYLDKDENEETEEKITDKIWFILLTGVFVVAVITAMVYILPFEKGVRQLFVVCTILFVIITIVEGMYAKGMFEGDVTTPSEEDFKRVIQELEQTKNKEEEPVIDMSFAEEFVEKKTKLKEVEGGLLENKRRKMELEAELEEATVKLKTMEHEVSAITLAINAINEISKDIQDGMKDLLVGADEIVKSLTDGRYDDVRLEMSGHVTVRVSGNYINIDRLSYGDLRLIYLAVKLSVAKSLCKNKEPIILDDIFTDCTEKQIVSVMKWVSGIDTDQVIVLTTNAAVAEMLSVADIEYNYQTL
ncbi:MAG: AAA family ATPase [Clostridium sp.]|nr:AAA family ATPase [Clostridium sp.]MCM1399028.1 AAA family ATPase [Clostridium sp.]MCM1458887.1 AAA family ATPase [Bacteroides sp.]